MSENQAFNPAEHLSPARKNGPADYLAVKWRLVWLRAEHPAATIETEKVAGGMESNYAEFKARVSIPEGGSATGYGSESKADFGDFIEKAETKAIGRALAALGYGTQFVGAELDEGLRIVDSPTERPASRRPAPAPGTIRMVDAPVYPPAPRPTPPVRPQGPRNAPGRPTTPQLIAEAPSVLTNEQHKKVADARDLAEAGAGWAAVREHLRPTFEAATKPQKIAMKREMDAIQTKHYPGSLTEQEAPHA